MRAVTMPRWLHLVGLLAAIAAVVRLLLIALRSARRAPAEGVAAAPKRRWRRPEPTVKRVKARDHFGLRGVPR
jgi:hypothetical protein